MREPLDLERPREQVCPFCHDHGWLPPLPSGERPPCDQCSVGQGIIATGVAKRLLQQLYSTRDADLFLESRSPTFGGLRPKELLREGGARAESVLVAIERIPGVLPRDARPDVVAPAVEAPTVTIEKSPEDEGAVRRVLAAKARQYGEHQVARALELRTTADLNDRERALFDAAFFGNGYLIDGKRVDPSSVEILRWPA